MKIVVYPHDLGIGGSQLNAIEIAAAVQRRGHDVVILGRPGPLVEHIDRLGLEFIEAPEPWIRPTPAIVRSLTDLSKARGIDILHGYEWPPALECLLAARKSNAAAVGTIMSMAVAPFVPKSMPLMVGTADILAAEHAFGRTSVELLEPPVDLELNNPDVHLDTEGFRQQWGIQSNSLVLGMVTRLADELKLEGILAAIQVAGELTGEFPVQLVIVGDGTARTTVQEAARNVNHASGQNTVILTGELPDPRAAYAVADISLGMGGSALRALAFAKPLIVQGQRGFWKLLTPESLPTFLQQGWYGTGTGVPWGAQNLASIVREISSDTERMTTLGEFGLKTVQARFSLARAAEVQEDFYQRAIEAPSRHQVMADTGAVGRFIAYQADRRLRGLVGKIAMDDFNARPVQSISGPRHSKGTQMKEVRT
ncbi:glycosyltransferase family 4 protein [Pseudarthrobacter sp. PS3-L1]|uniref:glycosyltransferase family 4 protein n=1 Tax=Pseudarthrobacter sp. PS3-L1 TaxID=3046207 RepID=UPI0024B8E31C|nr:glycosyltransferase family 4 protein [Pseudarthrobacter sp. PS3-L1]MDJ0321002.1 glycosyltransferase family 4 protein [Pseudarthrobacter sp. PS3-L1]